MSLASNLISVIRRIAIVIVIAIAFLFGVVTTVYLSLRSPEVKVPDILGKDRFEAERILDAADLKFRVRATRPSNQTKPDTVLFQLPRAGEIVKTGQTVAMDISRVAKEGESSEVVKPDESDNQNSNTPTITNENKPKPKPKNTNSNANGNGNANANANKNANSNRQANVNRSNENTINVNVSPRSPVNSNANSNLRPPGNQNVNRRPVTPRPTPTSSNSNRPPR